MTEKASKITEGIIKRLQTNEKAYCKMDTDLRAAAMKIGKHDNFQALWASGNWQGDLHGTTFDKHLTYRLKADYEQESEIVECKIISNTGHLVWFCDRVNMWIELGDSSSRPNFIGFKFEDGTVAGVSVLWKRNNLENRFISENIHAINADVTLLRRATHVLFRR